MCLKMRQEFPKDSLDFLKILIRNIKVNSEIWHPRPEVFGAYVCNEDESAIEVAQKAQKKNTLKTF